MKLNIFDQPFCTGHLVSSGQSLSSLFGIDFGRVIVIVIFMSIFIGDVAICFVE